MDTLKPRHPKALPFLFLTEMWERFGFYVIQGLLVLYILTLESLSSTHVTGISFIL